MKTMRALGLLVVMASVAAPAWAQITIDGGQGQKVIIGPGGVNVEGAEGTVRVGPGGVNVMSGSRSVTSTSRPLPTVTRIRTMTTKTSAPAPSKGLSLFDKLAIVERAAYGQPVTNKALLVRIDELEVKVLGQKGTGSSAARIDALANALGVKFTAQSTASVKVTPVTTPAASEQVVVTETNTSSENVITINDNGSNDILRCNNSIVVLNSNGSHIRLTGSCSKLLVNGDNNMIDADAVAFLQANGNNNRVTYRGNAPVINNLGSNNSVGPAR